MTCAHDVCTKLDINVFSLHMQNVAATLQQNELACPFVLYGFLLRVSNFQTFR